LKAIGNSMVFAAGLLFGTFVGAAAAVLVAPASGRELRGSLGREAKKLAVKATELVPDEWGSIVEEEVTKELVENIESLRAAGL